MIGKLNHVAIVVPDLDAAGALYREQFGAQVSDKVDLPEHGVSTVFVTLANTKIELLYPLGADSPIRRFLDKNPHGGVHHLCYEVTNLAQAAQQLQQQGMRILGDGKSTIGAHDRPVIFLHPQDTLGTLIELEQVSFGLCARKLKDSINYKAWIRRIKTVCFRNHFLR